MGLDDGIGAKLDWVGVASLAVNSVGVTSDGYGVLYHRNKSADAPNLNGLVIDTQSAWANSTSQLAKFSSGGVTQARVGVTGEWEQ